MFSIGEFARLGTVSVRTLRPYAEIGLHPAGREQPTAMLGDRRGAGGRYLGRDLGVMLGR